MVRVLLKFPEKIADKPITAQVIMEQKVSINILAAHVDQQGGEILVEIPSAEAEKVIEDFRKRGVIIEPHRPIKITAKNALNAAPASRCAQLTP